MKFQIKRENFLPHQLKWWELPNFIKLLVGGYGCGKTYIGALRSLYLSYINRPHPGQFVSPTYNMQHKTIIPHLKEICQRSGMEYTYKQQLSEFHIHNWGGFFWFGSGDKPDSLRGPNLAWAGIDEPFIQKKEVLDQMLARVRLADAPQKEIFLTGTPEELNWGYDLCMNDSDQYDVGYIYGNTKDNVHNDPEYFNRLWNSYTPEMREAYLNGKFVNLTQGRVYKPFDRDKHIIHQNVEGLTISAGLDFNVDYMTAEVFAIGNGWIHFIDEIRLTYDSDSFILAEKLRSRYSGINVYPDPTGKSRKSSSTKSDHQIFRDAGFRSIFRGQVKVRDRTNAVNKLLMHGRLTIEPGKCPRLVADLERNVWKNNDIDKQADISMTHAGDAAGYPIEYIYPVTHREAGAINY